MTKVLFLLNYRSGSNLFNFLNGFPESGSISTKERIINPNIKKEDLVVEKDGYPFTKKAYWMATKKKKEAICDTFYSYKIKEVREMKVDVKLMAWRCNLGGWWGEVKSAEDIPEPYSKEVFYGTRKLSSLPGDWKFVNLVRDPRNRIESMLNIKGGYEENRVEKEPMVYFEILCKSTHNMMRLVLDSNRNLENFKIFHFEDLVHDPLGTMRKVYSFLETELDEDFVINAHNFSQENVLKKHSSFPGKKSFNERWLSWNSEKKDLFKKYASNELIELGYEEDNDW